MVILLLFCFVVADMNLFAGKFAPSSESPGETLLLKIAQQSILGVLKDIDCAFRGGVCNFYEPFAKCNAYERKDAEGHKPDL